MDANVVLSALIGGKASKVFAGAKGVEFITTANVVAEILEYVPVLARKKGLNREVMEAAFNLLGLEAVQEEIYSQQIPAALGLIGKRDPDDVELVALALALGCPVWSNDNDLVELKEIEVYPNLPSPMPGTHKRGVALPLPLA
ncbi:MAG: putative ribonuclease VapC [Clostridia bacterium 62_21]|nr:MAG: putative ribonuclease VapC [Clostridia bacterium 62_21]